MKARWWLSIAGAIGLVALGARTVTNARAQSVPVGPGTLESRIMARALVAAIDGVAEVRAELGGRVLSVDVRVGDRVEVGQLLATVEANDVRAEVTRREAERNALGAAARAVAEGLRPEERMQVEAELNAARHDRGLAQDRLDRQLRLEASGSSTDAAVTEARYALGLADARLQAAEARMQLARSGGRPADVSAARSQEAAAAAGVLEARVQLDRSRIVAPIAGVVLARRIDPGDTALPAASGMSPALFEIADVSRTEVQIEVEEEDAMRLSPGLGVTLTTRGGKSQVARGQIVRIGARLERRSIGAEDARVRADAQVRSAWVAWVGATAPSVAIGQQLEAVIDLPPRSVPAMVPREAVTVRDGRALLEVPRGPFVEQIPVVLGSADQRHVEVRGVAIGTRVLLHR